MAVTDRHGHARPLAETVQAILDGGGRWIWFRDRDLESEARLHLGEAVAGRVRSAGGVLTVGGDIALARALGADGLHLGSGSGAEAIAAARDALGPGALIGVSAHAPQEIAQAAAPGTPVVKAFNTLFSHVLSAGPARGLVVDVFLAGDDAAAKERVSAFASSLGLRPLDTGPLAMAGTLENLALLQLGLVAHALQHTDFLVGVTLLR